MSILLEYSSTRQIILSTHSPYFIDWDSIINGGRIIRVTRDRHITKCYVTNENFKMVCQKLRNDINNPHVLGLDAKEAFFLDDDIIIVEGQEDVIIYQKIANSLNIPLNGNFFGWGAGGADKIELFLSMFNNLGFKHVVAIFDKDKNNVKTEVQPKYPSYHLLSIPCDDIRDKINNGVTIKEGVTDKNGNIKDEHKDEMRRILESINSYFEK